MVNRRDITRGYYSRIRRRNFAYVNCLRGFVRRLPRIHRRGAFDAYRMSSVSFDSGKHGSLLRSHPRPSISRSRNRLITFPRARAILTKQFGPKESKLVHGDSESAVWRTSRRARRRARILHKRRRSVNEYFCPRILSIARRNSRLTLVSHPRSSLGGRETFPETFPETYPTLAYRSTWLYLDLWIGWILENAKSVDRDWRSAASCDVPFSRHVNRKSAPSARYLYLAAHFRNVRMSAIIFGHVPDVTCWDVCFFPVLPITRTRKLRRIIAARAAIAPIASGLVTVTLRSRYQRHSRKLSSPVCEFQGSRDALRDALVASPRIDRAYLKSSIDRSNDNERALLLSCPIRVEFTARRCRRPSRLESARLGG